MPGRVSRSICVASKNEGVNAVFFHTGCNRENIGVKNNIMVKIELINQNTVGARTDLNSPLRGIRLAFSSNAMTMQASRLIKVAYSIKVASPF